MVRQASLKQRCVFVCTCVSYIFLVHVHLYVLSCTRECEWACQCIGSCEVINTFVQPQASTGCFDVTLPEGRRRLLLEHLDDGAAGAVDYVHARVCDAG